MYPGWCHRNFEITNLAREETPSDSQVFYAFSNNGTGILLKLPITLGEFKAIPDEDKTKTLQDLAVKTIDHYLDVSIQNIED